MLENNQCRLVKHKHSLPYLCESFCANIMAVTMAVNAINFRMYLITQFILI